MSQRPPSPASQSVGRVARQIYAFDIWDLKNLWDPLPSPVSPFPVQHTVLGSLYQHQRTAISSFSGAERKVLFLGRHAIEFWECLSFIKAQHGEESSCQFSTLPLTFAIRGPGHPITRTHLSASLKFSPLKHHFLRILGSNSSATSYSNTLPNSPARWL
ncbi:uncharacterized protein BDR25DRAFT_362004 [Lindgomyces ingoldianus]|uniref:Uncharacterized protein n=1 Tax=Lindgomyces ingoldianus TaxID=673940 RepID=A0ACB6QB04_9PLEO|nr:uncharacterized protein BDR25DRAFT_362004 [Lindgomyces ingoldianus]KAF2464081.1 hypothetical protein BDR25DRAFT_362004 [Lindgomyces ingoldianus]